MTDTAPELLVYAGPNGSGKSTVTKAFPVVGEYINADDIKKCEKCDDLQAAKIATALRENFLNKRMDFTFETVLSTDRNVDLLKRAKQFGYKIFVVFVLTCDVEINIARVQERVKNGGHGVPVEKIKSRYYKSLANIKPLLNIADSMKVIDNSGKRASLILNSENGKLTFNQTEKWTNQKLKMLVDGKIKK